MATVTLAVKSQDSSGVTYADPAKPDSSVRFRFSTVNKSLNGVQVPNYAVEIIANDNNPITVGGVAALDALSVRVRISGSIESKGRLRDILTSIGASLAQWETENVVQGFRPVTAPYINDAL
jgi:hypothetical protein